LKTTKSHVILIEQGARHTQFFYFQQI